MAERNFNDPEKRDEYRRQLEDERNLPPRSLQSGPPISPRPRRGAGAMWWWLLFLAVVIACIWLIPWGTRHNTGTNAAVKPAASTPLPENANSKNTNGYATNPATEGAAPQPTTVGDLTANPKSFEGTNVVVRKATVEQRLGKSAVLIGPGTGAPDAQQSVTVLLPANQSNADLRHGSKVQITGTLTAAPASSDNLGLTDTEAQHMRQQGFYLRASAIAPTSEVGGGGGGR
ncbi:MAG TPA: hypothetical protein VMB66_07030 [Candidatus Acidoferrales bacterium]|nr:hypothetical protein [Candidatus Acidoferrales bacterium]